MAEKGDHRKTEKKAEKLGEKRSEVIQEAVEEGYSEDGLTDQQKEALKAVEDNQKAAEEFQKSDDPDDYAAKRQQV
jgi:hypothetical protein